MTEEAKEAETKDIDNSVVERYEDEKLILEGKMLLTEVESGYHPSQIQIVDEEREDNSADVEGLDSIIEELLEVPVDEYGTLVNLEERDKYRVTIEKMEE